MTIIIRSDISLDWGRHLHLNAEEAIYIDLYRGAYTQSCSITCTYMRKHNCRNKPLWMDTFAFRKVKHKHSKYVRYLNTKADDSYKDFVKPRNEAAKAIRYAEQRYECRLAKTNKKAIWKVKIICLHKRIFT